MREKGTCLAALLLALTLLTACGQSAAPAAQTTETPAETAAPVEAEAPAAPEQPDLDALGEALRALYPEMMEVEPAMRLDFLGIAEDDCLQCLTLLAADGTKADELWLLEAADDDALERLQALAESRMKAKAQETETYAPAQYQIVQRGQVLTVGRCLALIVTERSDEAAELVQNTLS